MRPSSEVYCENILCHWYNHDVPDKLFDPASHQMVSYYVLKYFWNKNEVMIPKFPAKLNDGLRFFFKPANSINQLLSLAIVCPSC